MRYRVIAAVTLIVAMALITKSFSGGYQNIISSTLVLGLILLISYSVGFFGELIRLPRLTGYILTGIVLGPYVFNFISKTSLQELHFLNNLALAFIAFNAGAELQLDKLRKKFRTISFIVAGITIIVFSGVTLTLFGLSFFVPILKNYPFMVRLVISAIIGVISIAISPSSAIAIISEVKAKGTFTDLSLSVIVAMDVVVVICFAIVISFCQLLIVPNSSFNAIIIMNIAIEIIVAFVIGFFLGKGIIYLVKKLHLELPLLMAGMGFVVIKCCHLFGDYLSHAHNINMNIEPLLICMMAGFTVQNFSDLGETFINRLHSISLPIYVAFFTITGATIDLNILRHAWFLGLIIVIVRLIMMTIASFSSGRLAGESKDIYNSAWLGFITQAGISLGLLVEVSRRFPEIGTAIQSILIAAITINQIIGPITFKYILLKKGEAHTTLPFKVLNKAVNGTTSSI